MWATAWPSQRIQQLEASLKQVRSLVESPSVGEPDDVTRALARFLVVRASGFLEQVSEECCRAYISSKAAPKVHDFATSWLGYGNNPSPDRLVTLVQRFSHEWGEELRLSFEAEDQRLRRSIALLVSRRNQIAHGESDGMGATRALELAKDAMDVADWFIRRLDPR